MTSKEIRILFLQFFEERGHKVVPSSSFLPDDPSVLLTTAGMQQFKPYFTGEADPDKDFGSHRTVSIQKCFRTSDIDEVGDETHLTFFEMLGNFSFGPATGDSLDDTSHNGYFKKAAIGWAWEFLNEKLKIKNEKFYVTIFGGEEGIPRDDESFTIWKGLGFPEKKIFFSGKNTNFWGPTGDEGPCGPTTEIHYDLRGVPCEKNEGCIPNCECGRFVEFWNLVFNEYYQKTDKTLEKLQMQGVDTGMGLERLSLILQNKKTVFETDLFAPIIHELRRRGLGSEAYTSSSFTVLFSPGVGLGADFEKAKSEAELERISRIIADHVRGSTFLIAEGVLPSNLDRGYILRRLIRRSATYLKTRGFERDAWIGLVKQVIGIYGGVYPELKQKEEDIITIFQNEDEKFSETLERGLKEFEKVIKKVSDEKSEKISGEEAFYLYESYGFPFELTRELAEEQGLEVDAEAFEEAFKKHQELSRAGLERKFGGHGLLLDTGELKATNEEELEKATRLHTATHLLHQALRDVLGPHVKQMGSDITAERLRFDFTHPQKMTSEEIKNVEDLVNQKIGEDLKVLTVDMSYDGALRSGALAFFKLKYPSQVHVYSVGDYSREVCGGPHVKHTGDMGNFRITKEESSSAGVRRIRAILE